MTAKRDVSLGVRWTVGDVSQRGMEALRLSIHCAWNLFGPSAEYVVCVNTLPVERVQQIVGHVPGAVQWVAVERIVPECLRGHLDSSMAEGVGWKLLPLRLFPGRHELSLDNDCIVWAQTTGMQEWLRSDHRTLLASDVSRCLGVFQDSALVVSSVNSGIRGLPPGFDLDTAIRNALGEKSAQMQSTVQLTSELDEQGLQAVALQQAGPALLVQADEVTICSPFWPKSKELGTCGAHFVGLNSKYIPWNYYDRQGTEVRQEHWDEHRAALYRHAGLPLPSAPLG